LSFFFLSALSLFPRFLFAFVFASLITHLLFSAFENECPAWHFLALRQSTPQPVPGQAQSASLHIAPGRLTARQNRWIVANFQRMA